ncbi:MAG TPA: hypothetical protein VFT72_16275 [Opitutaceae bacterium]|nr:hypothetical protein [Opitutaceae bacterium]
MKLSSVLLTLSLGINAALALVSWSRVSHATATNALSSSSETSDESPAVIRAGTISTSVRRAPLWVAGGETDFDALIVRLRSAGISDRELSAVLMTTISLPYDKFLSELYIQPAYWQLPGAGADHRRQAELLKRRPDEYGLISKYLLTPELFPFCDEMVREARIEFGDFSIETLRKLTLQKQDQAIKSMDIELAQPDPKPGEPRFSAQNEAAQKALSEEQKNAIKALLSPEEYARYEFRNGQLAQSLRMRLQPFRPTEAEYKAIYAAEKTFRESDSSGPLTDEERTAPQKKRDADLLAALGPERAADYAELQKSGGELPRLMARLNLPLTTISTINKVRDEANASATAIRNNAQLTPAERSTQLAALAAKAEQTLSGTLGAEGFEAYSESKGDWLRSLKQPPTAKH